MDKFELHIPDRIRGWLYVISAFAAPTIVYLAATDVIGTAMVTLLSAYLAAINVMAKLNTPKTGHK